jgi:hypothetical protein
VVNGCTCVLSEYGDEKKANSLSETVLTHTSPPELLDIYKKQKNPSHNLFKPLNLVYPLLMVENSLNSAAILILSFTCSKKREQAGWGRSKYIHFSNVQKTIGIEYEKPHIHHLGLNKGHIVLLALSFSFAEIILK